MNFEDTDYVDVAARIVEFREKHPDGSLRPLDPAKPYTIESIAGTDQKGTEVRQTFIVVAAAAYRTPDDPAPGVGMAYEVFPGRTNFTRGSELQNAETSAWGRAIVACLAADTKRGVASAQEVRNRRAEQETRTSDPSAIAELETNLDAAQTKTALRALYGQITVALKSRKITDVDASRLRGMCTDRANLLDAENAADQHEMDNADDLAAAL